MDELFEYVYRCLLQEYGDPLHHMYWDSREGGWEGNTWETNDVLLGVGNPFDDGGPLTEAFVEAVEHEWYASEEIFPYEETAIDSWDSFTERLIEGPRFLSSMTERRFNEMCPQEIFDFLVELNKQLKADFVRKAKPGLKLFRGRLSPEGHFSSPDDLGSLPAKDASSQRLSAAGVPCFYAAEDKATALAELKCETGGHICVGEWVTTEPVVYVDFGGPIPMPSIFDWTASHKRPYVAFLQKFVERIQRPVDHDHGKANSYLPTQVLAEYFRYYLPTEFKTGVDAVRYPSSKADGGGSNWILFGRPDKPNEGEPSRIRLTGPPDCA